MSNIRQFWRVEMIFHFQKTDDQWLWWPFQTKFDFKIQNLFWNFAKNMHWNKNLQHFGILTLVLSISNDFITSLFWKYQMQLCYTAALNKINCYRNHFIWKHVRILNCSKCSFNLSLIQAKMGQTMRFWWEGQPVTIMWELSTLGKLSRYSFTWSKDM